MEGIIKSVGVLNDRGHTTSLLFWLSDSPRVKTNELYVGFYFEYTSGQR